MWSLLADDDSVPTRSGVVDFSGYLTEKQLEVYQDDTRHRVLVGGRGSGKTAIGCCELLRAALETPKCHVIYFSTTIKRGLVTVFDRLKELNSEHHLNGEVKESGTITFPNGSKVIVTGAETKKHIDRFRGVQRIAFVHFDECQDQNHELLEYGVGSVFLPRLNDPGVRGRLLLSGTGSKPKGYYHRAFTDKRLGFGKHHWLYTDGPDPVAAEEGLLEALTTLGVGIDDNYIRREFWGEFNAGGVGQILKPADACFIRRADIPATLDTFVIAADFGTVDACAIHVTGFTTQLPDLYTMETNRAYALGAADQVRFVRETIARYKSMGRVYVVGDGGGLGKALVIDLQKTEQFYQVEPAEKANKVPAMRNLAAALATGKFKVPLEEQGFIDDLQVPEWDPDHHGERIRGHVPDKVDAALYGYRKALTIHRYKVAQAEPTDPRVLRDLEIQRQLQLYHAPPKSGSRWT